MRHEAALLPIEFTADGGSCAPRYIPQEFQYIRDLKEAQKYFLMPRVFDAKGVGCCFYKARLPLGWDLASGVGFRPGMQFFLVPNQP